MFPKVNPLHAKGRRETLKADYKVLRPKVREDTYIRDGMRCRCPCRRMMPLRADTPLGHIHIHETEKPRQEAAIDVTLRSTLSLAPECHEAVEKNRLHVEYADPELRCNGAILFTGRLANGRILVHPYRSEPTLTGTWRSVE